MGELESIINRYLTKDGMEIVYYDIDQVLFDKVIKNVGKYEKPDILSIFDNKIIGIEHFEFDSFKKKRKGSDFKIKDNYKEKNIQKQIDEELLKKDSVIVHGHIESTATLKNYFNNFRKIFASHYDKIDSYFEHIKVDFDCSNKEVIMCFFADDVSPLGSYFLDENRDINLLNPLYSDDIVDMLNNSPKVKFLIIGTFAMKEYKLIIIENKPEVLKRFSNEKKTISENDFFSFSPITTGFATKINGEKI